MIVTFRSISNSLAIKTKSRYSIFQGFRYLSVRTADNQNHRISQPIPVLILSSHSRLGKGEEEINTRNGDDGPKLKIDNLVPLSERVNNMQAIFMITIHMVTNSGNVGQSFYILNGFPLLVLSKNVSNSDDNSSMKNGGHLLYLQLFYGWDEFASDGPEIKKRLKDSPETNLLT